MHGDMCGVMAAGWVPLTPVSPCILLCLPLQINMLLQYKGGADEEECPVPEDIRDELLDFHNDLLAHCGETGPPPGYWDPPLGHRYPQGHRDTPILAVGDLLSQDPMGTKGQPHPRGTGTPTQGMETPNPLGTLGDPQSLEHDDSPFKALPPM